MKFILLISTVILHNQLATSQILRPPPFTRPIAEQMIENGKFINLPPNVIMDPSSVNIVPTPNIVPLPRTTVITDCSPSICENLANTIQLMIVCNLLQNRYSSDFSNKLTGPVLNDMILPPALSSCNNVITPRIVNPNIPPSNIIPPSFYPNVINPNVITPVPSVIPSNIISHNVIPPGVISPSVIPPGIIPTAIAPTCPNAPQLNPANVNALLNTLMGMLGNIRA